VGLTSHRAHADGRRPCCAGQYDPGARGGAQAPVTAPAPGAEVIAPGLDVAGQVCVMTLPLRDARITGEDVGYARAHATSTPHGDACGSDAIAQAIGAHSVVTATRSVTGHMSGRPGPWVRPW
jgi:3-oxoacyl-[acyl-carrier-protein] synthase II